MCAPVQTRIAEQLLGGAVHSSNEHGRPRRRAVMPARVLGCAEIKHLMVAGVVRSSVPEARRLLVCRWNTLRRCRQGRPPANALLSRHDRAGHGIRPNREIWREASWSRSGRSSSQTAGDGPGNARRAKNDRRGRALGILWPSRAAVYQAVLVRHDNGPSTPPHGSGVRRRPCNPVQPIACDRGHGQRRPAEFSTERMQMFTLPSCCQGSPPRSPRS
jgi:hypothetical protein